MKPTKTPELVYPLSDFYDASGLPCPELEIQAADALPQPYRDLLVHDTDMTSVLEAHHDQPMSLRVLSKRRQGESLLREVVLVGVNDHRIVEFGAIRIELDRFDAEPRQVIIDGRIPLGAILVQFAIDYTSRPIAYFRVNADAVMKQALQSTGDGVVLYGRHNQLFDPQGDVLAEVIEILPSE